MIAKLERYRENKRGQKGLYNNYYDNANRYIQYTYVCDSIAVADKICKSSQLGQFIARIPADQQNTTSIMTTSLTLNGSNPEVALYKVEETGYYCVALFPTGNGTYFEAWVEWKFPYGELPAVDYPKLLVCRETL